MRSEVVSRTFLWHFDGCPIPRAVLPMKRSSGTPAQTAADARAGRRDRCRGARDGRPGRRARASSSAPTRTPSSGATRSRRRRSPARSACARFGSRSSGSPGRRRFPPAYQNALKRLVLDSYGIRVVVSVYGLAADTPRTPDARTAYCSFVADLLRDNPEIDDVAIWNDPNDGTFWAPQFGSDGASVAPADYEALLAELLRPGARRAQERERDRRRRLEVVQHSGCLHAGVASAGGLVHEARRPPTGPAAGRSRSSTRSATSRTRPTPRSARGRSIPARRGSRSATTRR